MLEDDVEALALLAGAVARRAEIDELRPAVLCDDDVVGAMSRWTIPLEWTQSSASITGMSSSFARSTESLPPW